MDKNQFTECAKRLKECREENHYTLEEIGNKIGVHKSTILRWENGETGKIKNPILKELATLYNVNIVWLMGYEAPKFLYNNTTKSDKPKSVKVPVLGYVRAGIPLEAIEEILDYEEIPAEWTNDGSEYFGLTVKGDSMFPYIIETDVIIFKKQNNCENGQIAVALVNGDEATIKIVKNSEDGITLVPFNPMYPKIFYSNYDIQNKPVVIVGVLKELRRKNFNM